MGVARRGYNGCGQERGVVRRGSNRYGQGQVLE